MTEILSELSVCTKSLSISSTDSRECSAPSSWKLLRRTFWRKRDIELEEEFDDLFLSSLSRRLLRDTRRQCTLVIFEKAVGRTRRRWTTTKCRSWEWTHSGVQICSNTRRYTWQVWTSRSTSMWEDHEGWRTVSPTRVGIHRKIIATLMKDLSYVRRSVYVENWRKEFRVQILLIRQGGLIRGRQYCDLWWRISTEEDGEEKWNVSRRRE